MKAPYHVELVCKWSSRDHRSIWDPSVSWTRCKWIHRVIIRVTQHVTCGLFGFCLQLLSSMWDGAVHTIFEIVLKEVIAGIHVHWTWCARLLMSEAPWKSIWQDTATKHIMQDVQDNIHCVRACAILLQHLAYVSFIVVCVCWPVPSHHTFVVATGTTSSNFCTIWLIAVLSGALLNFLQSCLCTVTKLLVW